MSAPLQPPPTTTELLERDHGRTFTGKMGPAWVNWIGGFVQGVIAVLLELAAAAAAGPQIFLRPGTVPVPGARILIGRVVLVAGSATVTLSPVERMTHYVALAADETAANPVRVRIEFPAAGQVTFLGTGSDVIAYALIGS